jgi:hypothetical protein
MFELMKIVGLSAVLSAGVVTASEYQGQAAKEAPSAKIYTERLSDAPQRAKAVAVHASGPSAPEGEQSVRGSKGDSLRKAQPAGCANQAWPHIARECLTAANGTPVRSGVRTITVEQREGANTSILIRVPASEIAQR